MFDPGRRTDMAGAQKRIFNFSLLAVRDERLTRFGALAEHHFPDSSECLPRKAASDGEMGQRAAVSPGT